MRLLLLLLLFCSSDLFSQDPPFKFGKVEQDILNMTVYEPDTSAEAVVIAEHGNLEFYFSERDIGYVFKVMIRIKILKRSGFEYGDIKIPYYSKDKLENVYSIKAKVTAPDGTVTNLDKKDIFEEEVNEYWSVKRFSCPNLQVGSVIDYQYETKTKYIFQLPTWYFQSGIPVMWSELWMEVPELYQYAQITQGKRLDINEETYFHRSYLVPSMAGGTRNTNLRIRQSRMVMKDVPALREEPHITTMEDYYASIKFQLASILNPDGSVEEAMGTWEKLYWEIRDHGDFGKQYTAKRNYKDIWEVAEGVVPKDGTSYEKAAAIHDFLTTNIEIKNARGYYTSASLNECFSRKTARAHEANLMMVALLREAGINAYPILISTRSHGRPLPLYPLKSQFNHVLALADLDGKATIIDMADPFVPMGYPARNSLNQLGWAIIDDKPEWVNIIPPASKATSFFNFSLDQEGVMSGEFALSESGYYGAIERKAVNDDPSYEYIKEWVTDDFPDASVDSIVVENQHDLEKTWKANGRCVIPDATFASGDFMYVTPVTLTIYKEAPFKKETRLYPVDFWRPVNEQIIFNLELPEGYLVEALPESARVSLPEDSGLFEYRISQNGNALQLICKIQVNKLRFEAEEYPGLRNFFSIIEEKLGEQVVLKKG